MTNTTENFAAALNDLLANAMNEDKVRAIVEEQMKQFVSPNKTITVVQPNGASNKVSGLMHKQFTDVLLTVSAKVHCALIGAAGAGKTHVATQVAEALGIEFEFNGVTLDTYDVTGYLCPKNGHIETPFYKAFVNGGLYLCDEFDRWSDEVQVKLNAALANGFFDFPNGRKYAHDDFVCILAMNTWGNGATQDHQSATPIDKATLDRLALLAWEYDNDLELALAHNKSWTLYVQAVREVVKELDYNIIVSPRATDKGERMLHAGLELDKVKKMVLWNNLDSDQIAQIEKRVNVKVEV